MALLAAIVARSALSLSVMPWQLGRSDQGAGSSLVGSWQRPQERTSLLQREVGGGAGSRESGWPLGGTGRPAEHKRAQAQAQAPPGGTGTGTHDLHEQGHVRKKKTKFQKVKPLIQIPGNVSRWQHPLNLVEELGFHKQLGGSFSLMCTLQLEQIAPWQRVFDFSFAADIDSITAGALSNTSHLHFTIFKGQKKSTVKVWDFFEPGKRITALFTVNSTGRMRVWKNGELAAEIDGHAPYFNDRPHLMIGGHYLYKRQFFHGVVGNVKIWSKEVVWPPAPGSKLSQAASLARRLGGSGGGGVSVGGSGGVSVGGPLPIRHKPPKATTTAAPTPAPHAWSRILTDDVEQKSRWMDDQPGRVMIMPTTTTRSRFHYSDMDEESQSLEEGPPLPKPPPQHWPQMSLGEMVEAPAHTRALLPGMPLA